MTTRKTMITVIIVFIVALTAAAILIPKYIYDELPYRIAREHTIGTINVGDLSIHEMEVRMVHDNGEADKTTCTNGAFAFKKGVYGMNDLQFEFNPSSITSTFLNKEITFSIPHFNTNWWHVNDVQIKVDINENPKLTARLHGTITTRGKSPVVFDFDSGIIDIDENTTIVRAGTKSP